MRRGTLTWIRWGTGSQRRFWKTGGDVVTGVEVDEEEEEGNRVLDVLELVWDFGR